MICPLLTSSIPGSSLLGDERTVYVFPCLVKKLFQRSFLDYLFRKIEEKLGQYNLALRRFHLVINQDGLHGNCEQPVWVWCGWI